MNHLSSKNKQLVIQLFVSQLIMGVYLLLVGSVLPSLKEEYHIGYQIGGMMMSLQSIGYLVVGVVIGFVPRFLGIKKTYLIIGNLAFVGLAIMMITGNPVLLLVAMLLTGISKACSANFANQIVNNLTHNDASMMNLTQAMFAIGACLAPVLTLVCGASWRTAFAITIVMGIGNLLFGLRIEIGADAYTAQKDIKISFGFLKTKSFWLCSAILGSYLAIESSVMGWLVTYFVDTGVASEATAQLISIGLWGALLVGRFACAKLAQRFQPYQMLTVMTIGVTICFTLLLAGTTLIPMAIGAVGLGLFMAGMYGTAIGDTGDMLEQYPMCMGMFIAIPGVLSAVAPSAVGSLANIIGIRGGMAVLYGMVVLLLAATLYNIKFQKQRKKTETAK